MLAGDFDTHQSKRVFSIRIVKVIFKKMNPTSDKSSCVNILMKDKQNTKHYAKKSQKKKEEGNEGSNLKRRKNVSMADMRLSSISAIATIEY